MISLVPTGGDVTLRLAEGSTWDVGRRFVADLVAAACAGTLPRTGRDTAATLMLTAGANILADHTRATAQRLRGLGAVLTGLQRAEHGVRLRLDDLELAAGTTECAADVLAAAASPAPYDNALRAACADIPPGHPVRLVVERDQQLPAACTAAQLLRTTGNPVELTGRFATACWPRLRTLTPFTGATLAATPRGLGWEVADAFVDGTEPRLRWRERSADPIPAGRWAGRVALRELGEFGELVNGRAPHTAILGVCGDPRYAIGRGGTTLGWADLARAVDVLRQQGTVVLAELWLGAPRIDPAEAGAAAEVLGEIVDRVVGLRVFDWPVGWTDARWAGRPVRLAPAEGDLARHVRILDPQPPTSERLAAALTAVGRPLASAHLLVPGRVAGAYLLAPTVRADRGLALDPDAVLGWRSSRAAKAIAVNMRTGACTRVSGAVVDLLGRQIEGEDLRAVVAALPVDVVRALRDGDVVVGST